MKQWVGFSIALLAIPFLFLAQRGIVAEWYYATEYKQRVQDSIVIEEPLLTLPVTLLNSDGQTFSEVYVEWREPLALHQFSHFAQQIFLQSEDRAFYTHKGYDIAAIIRAFAMNSVSDDIQQGASTITQQLVRMRFLTTEKTYERKFKELLFSAELEKQFSKDEILEMYLNEMYFANRVYGLGAAATYYFSRPFAELNEAEIAFLAAIPNNPSFYDPLRHFDRTKTRQERLLDLVAREGVITKEEAEMFKGLPIHLKVKQKVDRFPMYSDYVMSEAQRILMRQLGYEERLHHASIDEKNIIWQEFQNEYHQLLQDGLIIETALAEQKQNQIEMNLDQLLSPYPILQMGGAVVSNDTREIIALYAGQQYEKAGFHRAYQAVRQPGSAIKPLLVYAPLLEQQRYTPQSLIDSSNICIHQYCPKNIGRATYGMTTLDQAFRYSYNTAAVRSLQRVGLERAFDSLEPFNFEHITEQDHTYAAALGGFTKGFTPLEIAKGYSSFIDGYYLEPTTIRSLKTSLGDVLYQRPVDSIEVWNERTVNTMRQLLQSTVLNGTAQGLTYSTNYTGAKTGTTDYYKDLWIAGLNDHYTAAIWLGNDENKSIEAYSSAKLHHRALSYLLNPYDGH